MSCALPGLRPDRLEEACAVFGVYAPGEDVARMTCFGLQALQHRGQESAGIAVGDGETILVEKDLGLVTQVFSEASLSALEGFVAVGHARYSTSGAAASWEAAQPHISAIDETLIGSSQTLQLDYKLPDGVSLAGTRTKCSMQLSIKNYRERQITFIARRITVEGVEDGLAAEAASPLFLTVCGTYDVVSQLSASDIKAYISADGLSEGTYYDYPVEVVFGSDEVRNVFIKNASDCTADLIITKAENTNE